jgi:flagellar hook-length control protein FliK
MLGLVIQPNQLRPALTVKGDALSRQSAALDANGSTTIDAHKGRSSKGLQDPRALQSRQIAAKAAGTQKSDAALSSKATATAFSGQLAAARHPDAMKTADLPTDLLSNPAMRVVTQTSPDTPASLNGLAANRLAPSVGSTAWGQALGEKVIWMAAGAQQTASLTLNPPNLGPLQVVLHISNDQATASFFSAQPEVRQALEAAFPRLREMMNEAGIQLSQASVSADTPQQNDTADRQAQRVAPPFPGMDEPSASGLLTVHAPVQQSGRGLIDTFA